MTDTKKMIEVMQAFEAGKPVETKYKLNGAASLDVWYDVDVPLWNWEEYDYRVKEEKPEPGVYYVVLLNGGPSNQYSNTLVWKSSMDGKALFQLRSVAEAHANYMKGIGFSDINYRVQEVRVV